jgi:acetoin utilization deacetylase AcuC-like enzyme
VRLLLEVIYHSDYEKDFSPGSLEAPQRIKAIRSSLQKYQPFIKPEPASEAELYLVHEPTMAGGKASFWAAATSRAPRRPKRIMGLLLCEQHGHRS